MPWRRTELDHWDIIGMNHYYVKGVRYLFVAMGSNGRYIKAEGIDDEGVFDDLVRLAEEIDGGQTRLL